MGILTQESRSEARVAGIAAEAIQSVGWSPIGGDMKIDIQESSLNKNYGTVEIGGGYILPRYF